MTRTGFTILALLLLAAAPAFAQTNVDGDWDVTINSPQGTNTVKVSFKQDRDKVSGVFKSRMGELPFRDGSLTGSDLTFGFTIPVQGMSLDITMVGKVEGASMTGKAKFGDFGEGDWTAKRADATSAVAPADPAVPAASAAPEAAAISMGGASGRWDVMLKTPGGDFPATATLNETSGALTGTLGSQMGEVPVTGSVDGKAVKISMVAQTPQGDLTVVMTGELDGDSIVNGKAEIAGMGQMEWSARRIKQ